MISVDEKRWFIYCPGLSLKQRTHDQLLLHRNVTHPPAQTIAVNGAFCKIHEWVDWWVIQDWELYYTCLEKVPLLPDQKMFFPSNWICQESNWYSTYCKEHGEGTSKYSERPHFCFKKNNLKDLMPFGNDLPWDRYTMLAAVGLAVLRGATEILIYGADLEGKGYFIDGLDNFRTNHEPARWEKEYNFYKKIQYVCLQNGIKLGRIGAYNG